MNKEPGRPNPPEDDVDRILAERDATFERDRRDAVDAKEALRESRLKLERLQLK